MSGGQLVVMDRSGRDVKRYSLPEGLVTLGSDPDCDIRVLLPAIKQHHATVVVHANQTIVRNVADGETLVNGHVVSVAALRHGDVITLGDRSLRWEYYEPTVPRPLAPEPALHVKRKAKGRGRKRGSEVALRKIEPAVRLALEMKHRTSTPGATKQVAIVQPQRRDEAVNTMETKTRLVTKPHRPYTQNKKAKRATKLSTSQESRSTRKRMTQSDLNSSHITEPEVRYSSIETDASANENKSNTKSRKTKSPRNYSIRNKTMVEDTSSRNVTPKQASNITDDSDKVGRKSKTQNSDSPKNKTPKIRSSKSIMNMSSNTLLEDSTETKASQWIASRKTSPRKSHTPKINEAKSVKYVHVATPRPKEPYVERSPSKMLASSSPIKVVPKRTPLRTAVLKKMLTPYDQNKSLRLSARKTQSAPKTRVLKIEEPLYLDDNKKAALMLLTRGSKSSTNVKPKTPVLVIKKSVKTTPKKSSEFERKSKGTPKTVHSPNSSVRIHSGGGDSRERRSRGKTVTRNSAKMLTDDSVSNLSLNGHSEMIDEGSLSPSRNQILSPLLPSPKKSAMKDPSAKRNTKKIESIKFDLSNIESSSHEVEHKESSIVHERSNVLSETEEDLTLRYSESPPPTPSPRRSIHSRSSKIMEKSLGETFSINSSENDNPVKSITPSLNTRKSLRSSLIVEKALNTSLEETTASQKTSRNKSQRFTMPVDASLKRNTSEKNRSLNNMETYSIVDLVSLNTSETGSVIDLGSVEANESAISSSIYDSAASDRTSISTYHSSAINESQRSSPRRKTYSLMQSHIGTSTPYVGKVTPRKSSFLAKSHNKSESEMLNSPLSNNTSLKKSKSLINSSSQGSHSQTYDNDTNISVETTKQGDTFTITSSPRSTSRKKSSNASFTTTNSSQSKTLRSSPRKCKSKQSGSNTSLIAHGINEEPSTPPENVIATSEPSTPVLNIQHLLNSSNMLIKNDYKAHKKGRISKLQTVGPSIYKRKRTLVTRSICTDPKKGTRLSRVSRATLKSAKKTLLKKLNNDSSCISSKTDENAPEDDNEEKVTPKSTMVLVQPGVKEIHSTAKKPVSRRSIIDDLSESVIVKQLFNSPVKRKLSQSMTEFSKTEFTEDSTIRGKRKWATVGTTTRTPNQTLDLGNVNTPQVPTEVFISPINTPSPKLDGLKRLFANRTPENDLRNVSGMKRLLRTPRKQKSPRNDLTNVLGVKETFSKRSPANDLTNVTGVKDLYRLKRSKTRISRVQSPLQLNKSGRSPKNDLTDVQGVKRLFTMEESKRKKPKKGVSPTKGNKEILVSDSDISDDEELFEGPSGMDFSPNSTFDKLVGKPQIKATYSKSFLAKSKMSTKHSKATQSFHEPIDFTSTNVEKWLEQELHRKTHKETSGVSKARDVSKNVSISRELQKLTTDTLEGRTPILQSRVRSSVANNKAQIANTSRRSDQKRLSNLDRNSLPIKKRSIVNVSVTLKENLVHRKSSLPIKKRSVIHSTPVADRYTLASNVSELERVSPITVDKQDGNPEVFHVNISITTPTKGTSIKNEPKSPKTRNQQKQLKDATPEKKKTRRARAPKLKTPVSPRARRTRGGAKVADVPITKNVRTSLVIPKKPPVMSPNVISAQKASPRALRRGRKMGTETNVQLPNKSIAGKESHVKVTRGTRSRRIRGLETEMGLEKDVTVKNQRETKTRARDKRNSVTAAVVVTKPSPKMKPQSQKTASKQPNKKSPVEEKKKLGRRTRKTGNVVDKIEKPAPVNARSTRRTKNIEIELSKSTRRDRKILAAKSSPRSSKASVPKQETKRSLRARNNILSPNIKTLPSKNVKEPKERKQEKGRKRTTNDMAASEEEVVPRKTRRTVGLDVDAVPKKETRKTRKTVETTLQMEKKSKGRSRKIKESPKKTSSKKEKKDTSSVVQEKLPKGRKRNVEIAELGTSTRGRNTVKQEPTKRQRKGVEEKATAPSPAKTLLTRSQKKVVQVEGAGAKRRGRK